MSFRKRFPVQTKTETYRADGFFNRAAGGPCDTRCRDGYGNVAFYQPFRHFLCGFFRHRAVLDKRFRADAKTIHFCLVCISDDALDKRFGNTRNVNEFCRDLAAGKTFRHRDFQIIFQKNLSDGNVKFFSVDEFGHVNHGLRFPPRRFLFRFRTKFLRANPFRRAFYRQAPACFSGRNSRPTRLRKTRRYNT